MQNAILDYWPQILAIISLIVWLARLEMKVASTDGFKKMAEDIVEIKVDLKWLKEAIKPNL